MSVWGLYFSWPAGQLWPNLLASVVASAVAVGVAWWRLHRQSARQHAKALAQEALHHFDRLAQAEDHHKALMAHITAAEDHHKALMAHITATADRKAARP